MHPDPDYAPSAHAELLESLRPESVAAGPPKPPGRILPHWPVWAAGLLLAIAAVLPWLRWTPSGVDPVDPAEQAAFGRAVRAATPAAWSDFIARYPAGQFRREAGRFQTLALERDAFLRAQRENQVQGWERFLSAYPHSSYRALVAQRLAALRERDRAAARTVPPSPIDSAVAAAYSRAAGANTVAAWRAFLDRNPEPRYAFVALNNLGALLYAERDYEGALQAFERSATIAPENPRIHYNLGNTLLALGRIASAREAYRTALELDPEYRVAALGLQQASAQGLDGRLLWDGRAVAGAELQVVPAGAASGSPAIAGRSDQQGRFRLPDLPPGEYVVRAEALHDDALLSGSRTIVVGADWEELVLELQQEIQPAPALEPDQRRITLAWTPVAGAERYTVDLYDFGPVGGPSQVQSVLQQDVDRAQLRIDRDLAAGHEYRWRVRAYRGERLIGISTNIVLRTRATAAGSS